MKVLNVKLEIAILKISKILQFNWWIWDGKNTINKMDRSDREIYLISCRLRCVRGSWSKCFFFQCNFGISDVVLFLFTSTAQASDDKQFPLRFDSFRFSLEIFAASSVGNSKIWIIKFQWLMPIGRMNEIRSPQSPSTLLYNII